MSPSIRPSGGPDAVVIGGGHNGLVCAAYLARAGLRPLVLEARRAVGGCASTVDAVGARVNICNCDHIFFRTTSIAEDLNLAGHGLTYLDVDPNMVNLFWDGSTPWAVRRSVTETLDVLSATHPGEVNGYKRYVADTAPVAALLVEVATRLPTPANALRSVAGRRFRGAVRMARFARMSALDVARSYFSTDALVGPLMAMGPAVWGVSPADPGTGLGALGYAFRHAIGVGRPTGGSGALTDALQRSLEAAGGSVRCGARVSRIVTSGDRVVGVELGTGEVIETGIVVGACDPRAVLVDFLRDPPAGVVALRDRWAARPVPGGYESKIDAVIEELPRYRDLGPVTDTVSDPDDLLRPSSYICPPVEEICAAPGIVATGHVPESPVMFVNLPSVVDASMRPEGGHVFSLEALGTPYSLAGGWDPEGEPRRWLDRYGSLVEGDFAATIRDWRVVTPVDYERDFAMSRGYAPSFSGSPLSALAGRDRELTRYETPVEGLYLTGAGTFPGAGIWGASGRNAASVILQRHR
ncbi:MAG: NAD(P)/FAD-dependent oxidoreductase [Acidimicrobiales bacterium]